MKSLTLNENIWFAIAEPSRRKLIDILLAKGESTATKLAEEVPFSRQAIAKHLVVLKDIGLIKQRRFGKEVRFSIEPEGIKAAATELSNAASLWDERLQTIKRISERIEKDQKIVK